MAPSLGSVLLCWLCWRASRRWSVRRSRSGARSRVYRSKYSTCLSKMPNSRGSRTPLRSATPTSSSANSVTCKSSTPRAAPRTVPSSPRAAVTVGVMASSRPKSDRRSDAKRPTSTSSLVAPISVRARAMPSKSGLRPLAPLAPPCASPPAPTRLAASALRAPQMVGGIRPTIPKSMKPTRPSSRTRRFPACTSAWKKGQATTERVQTLRASTRVCSGFDE
mmetsp:Transcript_52149/g.118896  ORF Transcript_52149/g.118896 Transcript_52149/m.118896 type:complete len:221 (-) Transcript_52149:758-1420(-)